MDIRAIEKYLIEIAEGGPALLLKKMDEGSFNSLRIRFYKTRASLAKKIPELFSKVEISVKNIGDNKFLVISKPAKTIIYRLVNGEVVEESEEQDWRRIIASMAKDDASTDEVKEVIKDLPEYKQKELLTLFFDFKFAIVTSSNAIGEE